MLRLYKARIFVTFELTTQHALAKLLLSKPIFIQTSVKIYYHIISSDVLSSCSCFPHVYFHACCFAALVLSHIWGFFLIIGQNCFYCRSINDLFLCCCIKHGLWAVLHISLEGSRLIVLNPRPLVCKQSSSSTIAAVEKGTLAKERIYCICYTLKWQLQLYNLQTSVVLWDLIKDWHVISHLLFSWSFYRFPNRTCWVHLNFQWRVPRVSNPRNVRTTLCPFHYRAAPLCEHVPANWIWYQVYHHVQ